MADEPPLPTLHPSSPVNRRKRGRSRDPPPRYPSTSSDPAVFSSDDDPALDNYQNQGRRKKRYVGAWFDQQPASSDSPLGQETPQSYPPPRRNPGPQSRKREFRRELDSGVWMNSDASWTDNDDCSDLEPAAARFPLAVPRAQPPMPPSPARPRYSPEEQEVYDIVSSCLERGDEHVDLSGLGLESVSDGLLEPISDIAPIPTVAKDVAFEQKDPQIQVYLSNNCLRSFPRALLNVEHLTVLSLRANHLSKIPPAILKLRNLEALSIAQNYLTFLPGGMLDLLQPGSKLRVLHFRPNRFCQPDAAPLSSRGADECEKLTYGSRPKAKIETFWTGLTTKLHFRTPVQFVDSSQRSFSSFSLDSLEARRNALLEVEPFTSLAAPKVLESELRSHATTSKVVNPKGAKSLFELALRVCVTSGQTKHISSWLSEDEGCWPKHCAPVFERAVDIHREGGITCSVCGRDTLMPLAQWVEFREIGESTVTVDEEGNERHNLTALGRVGVDKEGPPVPFLMFGCSWKCVPVRVEEEVIEEKERMARTLAGGIDGADDN